MKKRNRVLALLLAVGLAVSLCGCGGSADSEPSPPSVPATQAVSEVPAMEPIPEPAPTPEPTPEPTPTPEPELHGLVILESQVTYTTEQHTVYCLNPECDYRVKSA